MGTESLGRHFELSSDMAPQVICSFWTGVKNIALALCQWPLLYFLSLSSLNVHFKLSGARNHSFAAYVNHAKCREVLIHIGCSHYNQQLPQW